MTDHPITPPPELVQQWRSEWIHNAPGDLDELGFLATRAAQWGSDQELEACCEWLQVENSQPHSSAALRAARRPKPPSLKEQALADLDEIGSHYIGPGTAERIKTIRLALEQLDD
jgi:hypothetical protein